MEGRGQAVDHWAESQVWRALDARWVNVDTLESLTGAQTGLGADPLSVSK